MALGNLTVIERGGRVHFPDIIRRILSAGAVACIFLETLTDLNDPMATHSLFDGFHTSSRQSIPIPIVLLSKHHSEIFIRARPPRVSIEIVHSDRAIKYVEPCDLEVAVAVAARAGEVELLKHLLYSDTSGKAVKARDSCISKHYSTVPLETSKGNRFV